MLTSLFIENNDAHTYEQSIHDISFLGELDDMKKILTKDPEKIEEKNEIGWTPIFCAASQRRMKMVKFLIEKEANLYVVDDEQCNIVERAKIEGEHTHVSKYLKSIIKIPLAILEKMHKKCQVYLKAQLLITKFLHKKLLILIGESHGDYIIYQLEKMLLKILAEMNINTVYSEQSSNAEISSSIDIYAEKKGMEVIGIDNYPDPDETNVDERNAVMSHEICSRNIDAVAIVGSDHLYGLMEVETTRINPEQFHIVAINLSRCVYDNEITEIESYFSHYSPKVIQFEKDRIFLNFPSSEINDDVYPGISYSVF